MEITKKIEGATATYQIKGNLDTTTSPDLQTELGAVGGGVTRIVLDFAQLDYISSAGLRVLLMANKKMKAAGGSLTIVGVNPAVREVFDMTGFSDIFDIA